MKYPKINSLYKRFYGFDDKNQKHYYKQGAGSLIEGQFACLEFESICKWRVVEKIDGTNTRIHIGSTGRFVVHGRNVESSVPASIQKAIGSLKDRFLSKFKDCEVWIFGEGYGPKIQKGGGNYRSDAGFIMFDIFANGWWLKQEDIEEIGKELDIPTAPNLGIMNTQEVVDFVKSKPFSRCSQKEQVMEGVICRPEPLLLFRNREPFLMKLKCRDF